MEYIEFQNRWTKSLIYHLTPHFNVKDKKFEKNSLYWLTGGLKEKIHMPSLSLKRLDGNADWLPSAHSETSSSIWHSWPFWSLSWRYFTHEGAAQLRRRNRKAVLAVKLSPLPRFPSTSSPSLLRPNWIFFNLQERKNS